MNLTRDYKQIENEPNKRDYKQIEIEPIINITIYKQIEIEPIID
jgi:hypothetical protein